MTTVDQSLSRLQRAGWSIGETATAGSWIVTGINGEKQLNAVAGSQAEAWRLAVEQQFLHLFHCLPILLAAGIEVLAAVPAGSNAKFQ
jgi:hypothetical protein